jgi:hypothetical protein
MTSLEYLQSLAAVRETCTKLSKNAHFFTTNDAEIPVVSREIIRLIERDYGTLKDATTDLIPPHGRLRQLEADKVNRWKNLVRGHDDAKRVWDIVVVSVLLDAGAGVEWKYKEASGRVYNRSEGLGIASYDMFCRGLFSDTLEAEQVTVNGLKQLSVQQLKEGMQIGHGNELLGLENRWKLLQNLASVLEQQGCKRPSDVLNTLPKECSVEQLWSWIQGLKDVWPSDESRMFHATALGDVWPWEYLPNEPEGNNLIVFHKLSQWLCYSLVEVLEKIGGWTVTRQTLLTGLPEYRNGGMLVDYNVLQVKPEHLHLLDAPLPVHHPLIIEWRALTVCLLDTIAVQVRLDLGQRLGKQITSQDLPLAKVLEAGTWKLGREVARKRLGATSRTSTFFGG